MRACALALALQQLEHPVGELVLAHALVAELALPGQIDVALDETEPEGLLGGAAAAWVLDDGGALCGQLLEQHELRVRDERLYHEHLPRHVAVGRVWRAQHVGQRGFFERGQCVVHQVVTVFVHRQGGVLVPEVTAQPIHLTYATEVRRTQ